jgi:hypothetical protein
LSRFVHTFIKVIYNLSAKCIILITASRIRSSHPTITWHSFPLTNYSFSTSALSKINLNKSSGISILSNMSIFNVGANFVFPCTLLANNHAWVKQSCATRQLRQHIVENQTAFKNSCVISFDLSFSAFQCTQVGNLCVKSFSKKIKARADVPLLSPICRWLETRAHRASVRAS